jgi:hypothetical protein
VFSWGLGQAARWKKKRVSQQILPYSLEAKKAWGQGEGKRKHLKE